MVLTSDQGGKQKKVPHYRNDLPHYPLVLCSDLPNDHGHFDEVCFFSKFGLKLFISRVEVREVPIFVEIW